MIETIRKIDARLPAIAERCFPQKQAIDDIAFFETEAPLSLIHLDRRGDFRSVSIGHAWGRPGVTGWFRYRFLIPEAMAGRTVFVFLDDGGEGLCYFQGAPLQGLDPNHREIRLVEKAEAGRAYELIMETAPQSDWRFFRGPRRLVRAELAALAPEVWDLYHDIRVLCDLARALPEDSPRRARILHAVSRTLDEFDYETANLDALEESARVCRDRLRPLLESPAGDGAQRLHSVGHAHIDVIWLWPHSETIRKCGRTFSTAVKLMDEYPEYRFVQSQPHLYELTREHWPTVYDRIRRRVRDSRWIPAGALWVEPDCNMTSGESLIRQLLLGKQYFREVFDIDPRVAWLPDTFGFTGGLPQILRQCGIDFFVTQKLTWGSPIEFPYDSFWWEGIDGSRVLAHFPPADTYNARVEAGEILAAERNYVEKDRARDQLYIYGYGDGGGGPTRDMLEFLQRAGNLEGLPRCIPSTPEDFFDKLTAASDDLPVWVGEMYYSYHRGTYTSQAQTKKNHRRAEILLHDAETWNAIAAVGRPGDYPADALRRAWRAVCVCQFHDILPGSSVAEGYRDAEAFYELARRESVGALDTALDALVAQIDTGAQSGQPIVVFNSLGWQRTGPVAIERSDLIKLRVVDAAGKAMRIQRDGNRWLFLAEDVPAYGYKTFWYEEAGSYVTGGPDGVPEATPQRLENRFHRIELDDAGEIRIWYDKENERHVLAEGETGNQLRLFDDRPHNWDAWEIDADYRATLQPLREVHSIDVLEKGPVRAAVRIRRKTERSEIIQKIVVWAHSPRVDFETEIDWHENHKLLKAAFPLAVRAMEATCETAFGHVRRPTHTNTPRDAAMFEVPAHRWADLSEDGGGAALLNDCKYGYDARGNVLSLTLLRSPKDPDPETDMGSHRFTYSLLPHDGDFRRAGVIRHGYELNTPLLSREADVDRIGDALPPEQCFLSVDAPNVVIETVKEAEARDGLIVRLYEAWGRRGRARVFFSLPFEKADLVNAVEERIATLTVAGGAIEIPFKPHEIVTLQLFRE